MSIVRINLNENIKVKLTDYGKDIYYHQYDELFDELGEYIKPRLPKEDANGFSTFQLWDFMEIFGKHMGMLKPNVISPLEIFCEVEEEK